MPGPHCQPMDASRHGPKKGGPIGPMGSTIGPFKYYVIHYQTLFKHFRAAGLPGQTGRPGPIKSISGRAWAGTSAHGQARHGPLIFSCLSGSCLNGPCLDGPVPGRAGPPVWPPIMGALHPCIHLIYHAEFFPRNNKVRQSLGIYHRLMWSGSRNFLFLRIAWTEII